MPATSASHMIFFIAAIVVATAITGVLITTTYKFSDSIEKRGGDIGDQIGTDIEIINDEAAMPYNASNNTLTVYVMNTGSTIINFDNATVIVMINGTFYDNLTFVLPSGITQWGPNVVITIVVGDVTLPDADYRLKVVVAGGADDKIIFRIG
jgi:flagellar protein FlaG